MERPIKTQKGTRRGSRLLKLGRSNGPPFFSLSWFKLLGFLEKKPSLLIQSNLPWKLACNCFGVPLTQVRARKKESVQIYWRGGEEGSLRPQRVWHEVPLFHSPPRPLFPSLFCRLSRWQIAHSQSSWRHRLPSSFVLQITFQETTILERPLHRCCPPAATNFFFFLDSKKESSTPLFTTLLSMLFLL